jgi:hypothetical protein
MDLGTTRQLIRQLCPFVPRCNDWRISGQPVPKSQSDTTNDTALEEDGGGGLQSILDIPQDAAEHAAVEPVTEPQPEPESEPIQLASQDTRLPTHEPISQVQDTPAQEEYLSACHSPSEICTYT